MKITINRSDEWCRKRAIETGETCPTRKTFEIEPKLLSRECRELIVLSNGYYTDHILDAGDYSSSISQAFCLDSDEPTADQISTAIVAAYARRDQLRAERDEENERKNRERSEKQAKREADEKAKQATLAEARKLFAPQLSKLETSEKLITQLFRLIYHINQSSIDAALVSMADADTDKQVAKLRSEFFNACPEEYDDVFSDDDDDDDE